MRDIGEEEENRLKDMQEAREVERQQIHEFNKQLLSNISSQLVTSEIFRCQVAPSNRETLETDQEDFREMKELITVTRTSQGPSGGDGMIIDSSSSSVMKPDIEASYFDVKRLLIQERGEDEYYFLFNRKLK